MAERDIPLMAVIENYKEKRRHERIKLSLNINWGLTRECLNDAKISSLSLGGCFIQTRYKFLSDQFIFLCFFIRQECVLGGRIRYTLLDVGAGVEFTEITDEDKIALEELIESYRNVGGS